MISFILILLFNFTQVHPTQTLTITITDLPSNTGDVYIGLYDGPELWLEDAPYGDKTPVNENRTATLEIPNLHPGTYAISFYHDSNSSGKMEYNFIGYPKEVFGFSAGAKAVFKAPSFYEAAFQLTESTTVVLQPQ